MSKDQRYRAKQQGLTLDDYLYKMQLRKRRQATADYIDKRNNIPLMSKYEYIAFTSVRRRREILPMSQFYQDTEDKTAFMQACEMVVRVQPLYMLLSDEESYIGMTRVIQEHRQRIFWMRYNAITVLHNKVHDIICVAEPDEDKKIRLSRTDIEDLVKKHLLVL